MAARAVGRLSRATGRGGGTTLPGKLLWKLDPGAIDALAARLPDGVALVSGTNGKTTTTAMTARILGRRCRLAWNNSGANLASGIASTLLAAPDAELGVLEVDEFALPEVIRRVRPRAVLLGNLFRDQLDRYGELEHIAERWRAAVATLDEDAALVVAARRPARRLARETGERARRASGSTTLVCADRRSSTRPTRSTASSAAAPTSTTPPTSGTSATTTARTAAPPVPHSTSRRARFGSTVSPARRSSWTPLPGRRGSSCRCPGSTTSTTPWLPRHSRSRSGRASSDVKDELAGFSAAFGRLERIVAGERTLLILLIKNPAGANEAIRTLVQETPPTTLLIALNDAIADGRDVSWIWDVDFEYLLDAGRANRRLRRPRRGARASLPVRRVRP